MKKNDWIRIVFDVLMRVGYEDNKQDSISEWCTKDGFNNPVFVKKLDLSQVDKLKLWNSNSWIDSVAVTATEEDFSDACDSDIRVAINDGLGHRNFLYINELSSENVGAIATRVSTLATIKPKELNLWELSRTIREYANTEPFREVKVIIVNKEGVIVDRRGLYISKPENPDNVATIVNGKDSVNIYVTI
jgi:hypothetical protein